MNPERKARKRLDFGERSEVGWCVCEVRVSEWEEEN